jgi:chemotaxis protein MotB
MMTPMSDEPAMAPRLPLGTVSRPTASWLITFADLAALMVAFFALLFSMGEIDADRWSATELAIDATLEIAAGDAPPLDRVWRNVDTIDSVNGLDLQYLGKVVAQQIDELPALAGARIAIDSQRLVVSLPQALLFESGGAELRPDGAAAVFALSVALASLPNELEIVGHTDPLPVAGTRWPSNWELSLTRAAVVAHELRLAGYGRPIRIAGAGSGRFDAVNPRLPLVARYTLARRVDIVVRQSAGSGS